MEDMLRDVFGEDILIVRRGQKALEEDDILTKLNKVRLELKFIEHDYHAEKSAQLQLKHTRGRVDNRSMSSQDFQVYEKDYKKKKLYIQNLIHRLRYSS